MQKKLIFKFLRGRIQEYPRYPTRPSGVVSTIMSYKSGAASRSQNPRANTLPVWFEDLDDECVAERNESTESRYRHRPRHRPKTVHRDYLRCSSEKKTDDSDNRKILERRLFNLAQRSTRSVVSNEPESTMILTSKARR